MQIGAADTEVTRESSSTSILPKSLPHHHKHNNQGSQSQAFDGAALNTRSLTFYSQKIVERRSRSTSRHARQFNSHQTGDEVKSDRSRSKSRDIVALYTSANAPQRSRSSTPAGSLYSYTYTPASTEHPMRSRSCTPAGSLASYRYYPQSSTPTNIETSRPVTPVSYLGTYHSTNRRSRSLARVPREYENSFSRSENFSSDGRRARSETRCSSMSRDAISLYSNLSTQSRALSNSEIASQNLELWMTTTSKNQRPSSKSRKSTKKQDIIVPLLEMDQRVNEAIEKMLDNANSVKPANVKMMMIASHVPSNEWSSEDEISVKHGAIVTGLYKQNEWLFISNANSSTGYVPFAYTKAVKLERLSNSKANNTTPTDGSDSTSNLQPNQHSSSTRCPTNTAMVRKSALKQSNKQNTSLNLKSVNQSLPPTFTTAQRRDSVSTDNSVFLENFMQARPSTIPRQLLKADGFADCLVVDTNYKYDGVVSEDSRAYCSDSGISEPNSTHSDEIDQYVFLANASNSQRDVALGSMNSHQRSNVVGHPMAGDTFSNCNHSDSNYRHRYPSTEEKPLGNRSQINFMPLGPLGERLQRVEEPVTRSQIDHTMEYDHPVYCNISQEMQSRAQSTVHFPSELKPKIPKDYNGPRVKVLYKYNGDNEDDIDVRAGEVVTVLNCEDIEWIWVMRRDGQEGFIPREYAMPTDPYQDQNPVRNLVVAL